MDRGTKLSLVTILTLIRFPMVLLFLAGALVYTASPANWLFAACMVTVIASAVTDFFDGFLARKLEVQTTFGAHVDPLMDKFFYLATLPLLIFVAAHNEHWMHASFLVVLTVLFLTRDQWVTFLRAMGSLYNVSGAAHWSGKLRTAINFPLICTVYYFEEAPWPFFHAGFVYAFEGFALLINMISIYTYTRRYWPCLRRSANVHH